MTLLVLAAALLGCGESRAAEQNSTVQVRGADVYVQYCALCHGPQGKGDGRAAGLQKTRPSDLTASRVSDSYRLRIVRGGGAAVNRSDSMPAWREVLSDQQIDAVAAYLRFIALSSSSSTASSGRAQASAATRRQRKAAP